MLSLPNLEHDIIEFRSHLAEAAAKYRWPPTNSEDDNFNISFLTFINGAHFFYRTYYNKPEMTLTEFLREYLKKVEEAEAGG